MGKNLTTKYEPLSSLREDPKDLIRARTPLAIGQSGGSRTQWKSAATQGEPLIEDLCRLFQEAVVNGHAVLANDIPVMPLSRIILNFSAVSV